MGVNMRGREIKGERGGTQRKRERGGEERTTEKEEGEEDYII